ncbi:MAG: ATP-binding cassette domain-containing protein [Candidatus Bathyarchaeia archaeon]|jgi:ABC-2 type transport system ATP-binding protein
MNAIETHNLTKTFKTKKSSSDTGGWRFNFKAGVPFKAVNNLNLEIKQGELFGLLGPNGAGKTTLVKMLCTLLPPDSGTALVNGYDVVKEPMKVKQSLGTLFSVGERGFFWRLNGYRNLEFYAAIYNVPRKKRDRRIREVIKLVGLENNAYDLYQRYSGGMKRKLALARTLLPDPQVLLLDEPTNALDVIASRNVRDFVRETVTNTGKSVLYTTHYIEEAAQICDRIGILLGGQIIACDTPDAIRCMIKKEEVVNFTLENISQTQVERLQDVSGVIKVTENNLDVLPSQKQLCVELKNINDMPILFDFLFKEKIKLVNFKRAEPTLEDAFIQLTKNGGQKP